MRVYDFLHVPVIWLRSLLVLLACGCVAWSLSGKDPIADASEALGPAVLVVPTVVVVWAALEIWMAVAKRRGAFVE